MAQPIYIKDIIDGFLLYASKKAYDKKYMDNLKIFMAYLIEDENFNLANKKDCERLERFAMDIVKAPKKDYPNLKATKVERGMFFNSFVDYLRSADYKGRFTKLEKIPFVMNDLERKLDLVKHYREYYLIDKLSAQEVADKYYVDEKTIRNDKREIKEGTLNAFGQKIDIEYDYDTKSFFSTPVPIFTVQNITQIVTMLNGLGIMYKDGDYREYALATAVTIWNQLTQTVQKRITDDLVEMLGLDKEWYSRIDSETDYLMRGFYSERSMHEPSRGDIIKYFKNNMLVDITYAEADEIKQLKGVRMSRYEQKTITVFIGEKEIVLRKENIIKVCESEIRFPD